jgi:hypothetical protein
VASRLQKRLPRRPSVRRRCLRRGIIVSSIKPIYF